MPSYDGRPFIYIGLKTLRGILRKICRSNRTPLCISCQGLPRQGSRQVTDLLSWRDNLLPWLGGKIFSLDGKSSASAGKSTLDGNMPDSAQIYRGRFSNSAPADAIVAALVGSECHQPGTTSVQLPIWH
ncbi:hypothetical protein V6N11_030542 [Hibiscus sabdariffa]|uniref:Uncharacterized protein n=1 Tax=Hibiscus sabdariffa TaxID=183260 RepID=A0ABR2N7B1_9ROSI